MAYDKVLPGTNTPTSADHAPSEWVVDTVSSWVNNTGDASKVKPGWPAYGYKYGKATRIGDTYDVYSSATVFFRDIPKGAVVENPDPSISSHASIEGSWTSIVSPADIVQTQETLKEKFPDLGGPMVWEAEGMNQELFDALK